MRYFNQWDKVDRVAKIRALRRSIKAACINHSRFTSYEPLKLKYRISCKVSRAIFHNLNLLGATNFHNFKDFYLISKPFWCDYVLRATVYQGRISLQEIR